ncbi:MAG: 3-phosphoserine/phosphohydroxythreonine transaminase [Ardenticatenaceae bacterium]
MSRVYNFSAGPAALPLSVLQQVQAEFLDFQGLGMSVVEMSHRSPTYSQINAQAQERFKSLLGLGDDYRVLFMPGGASTQFTLVAMNFLRDGLVGDYVMTGVWSDKAIVEAQRFGQTNIAASTKEGGYRRIPRDEELTLSENSAYVHITSNNTVRGTQWQWLPEVGDRPLVADMSSDILSRPFPADKHALIYAGAQKNLAPAGVTVAILRESWLAEANSAALPTMMRYETYVKKNSAFNTPPVFPIYVLNLVLGWIEENGGLVGMNERNQQKAKLIYDAIDTNSGFYRGHATPDSRSEMNVTFHLPSEELEKQFVAEAAQEGLVNLKGHRSMGGVRASIYNATEIEAAKALADFMGEFIRRHG